MRFIVRIIAAFFGLASVVLGFVVAIAGIVLFFGDLSSRSGLATAGGMVVAFGGVALMLAGFRLMKTIPTEKDLASRKVEFTDDSPALQIVDAAITNHESVLIAQRRKKLIIDAYGIESSGPWLREIGYFYDRIVLPKLVAELGQKNLDRDMEDAARHLANRSQPPVDWLSLNPSQSYRNVIIKWIDASIRERDIREPLSQVEVGPQSMSPKDYETFCAGELRAGDGKHQLVAAPAIRASISLLTGRERPPLSNANSTRIRLAILLSKRFTPAGRFTERRSPLLSVIRISRQVRVPQPNKPACYSFTTANCGI